MQSEDKDVGFSLTDDRPRTNLKARWDKYCRLKRHSRRESWKPVFPIKANDGTTDELQGQVTNTLTARYEGAQATGTYIIENQFNAQELEQIGCIGDDSEATRVYSTDGIARTIKNGGGMGAKTGLYAIKAQQALYPFQEIWQFSSQEPQTRIRRLTPLEAERLQGYPDGWTEGVSDTQRYKCLGNAVTVSVISAIILKMIQRKNI